MKGEVGETIVSLVEEEHRMTQEEALKTEAKDGKDNKLTTGKRMREKEIGEEDGGRTRRRLNRE